MPSSEAEIEMANDTTPVTRELQQDARAWASFTGTNYTAALRQMRSSLAQGLLGQRASARHLIAVLSDHPLIGSGGHTPGLGEDGFQPDRPWSFNGQTDFIELALITDTLRMFTPTRPGQAPDVGSYTLKHTTERFLGEHCPYVSNGKLIWAAAALGLPLAEPEDTGGPNLLIGVNEREHDYVTRISGRSQVKPAVHHYRPTGYEHLRAALDAHAAGDEFNTQWVPPVAPVVEAPFHDWLLVQSSRDDIVGDLAQDYTVGVRNSDHRVAHTAEELLTILDELGVPSAAIAAARSAVAEWTKRVASGGPMRTVRIGADDYDHAGWGAGTGDVDRYEYLCPCGTGKIIEEHDNVPGFREHDHWFACDTCRAQWRFVEGRPVRDWLVEPMPAAPGA